MNGSHVFLAHNVIFSYELNYCKFDLYDIMHVDDYCLYKQNHHENDYNHYKGDDFYEI